VVGGVSIGLFVAGLVSPLVGRTIQRCGGRAVLASSSILLAIGLVGIGLAQNLIIYLAAWIVIGLGMGAGLYDTALATLGQIYRDKARSPITTLTLFGGFSSTICWPLSGLLVSLVGWRPACFIYAGLQLVVSLPIYLLFLPRSIDCTSLSKSLASEASGSATESQKNRRTRFVLVGSSRNHSERGYTINDGNPPPHHSTSARDQNGNGCGTRGLGWTKPSLGAYSNDHWAPLSSDLDDVEFHGAGHHGPLASVVSLTRCRAWTCILRSGNENHVDCELGNQEDAFANPLRGHKDRSPDGNIPQPFYEVSLGHGEADEDVMFLVCPVDANSCLVGKWRRNIHKHLIAVYDLSRRKRVGTWSSKVVQSVR
jgi:hypothetical protein